MLNLGILQHFEVQTVPVIQCPKNAYKIFGGNLKGRGHSEGVSVDVGIILICILNK